MSSSQPRIYCIGGPSCAGKDTLLAEVRKLRKGVCSIPRYTTRPKRRGERDGVDYFFVSERKFDRLARKRLIGIDTFCGNKYGVDPYMIERALRRGRSVIGVYGAPAGQDLRRVFGKDRVVIIGIVAELDVLVRRIRAKAEQEPFMMCRRFFAIRRQMEELLHFDMILDNSGPIDHAVRMLSAAIPVP